MDRIRVEAYAQALRQTIRPGATVVDIGTGPGIMAVLACQLGAGRVFAIEPGPVIEVAREIALANGCAGKIEFIEALSTRIDLPVLADVIVSDMRGILPLAEQHIPSIADARRRFLAPGGTLIGRQDKIWAAIVESPTEFGKIVDPWDRNAFKQDLSPARRKVLNDIQKIRATPEQLMTEPKLWATLDYATVEDPDVQQELTWLATRSGIAHGIVLWFDADLADGVSFSNGPSAPEAIYGSMFLPWPMPVPMTADQTVRVDLQAKLLEGDYFWRWITSVQSAEKPNEVAVRFSQSQLQATVLSVAKLHKSASDYVPQLSDEGRINRKVFELMDGRASLEKIARVLTAEFPKRFTDWRQALSYAGAISRENA